MKKCGNIGRKERTVNYLKVKVDSIYYAYGERWNAESGVLIGRVEGNK